MYIPKTKLPNSPDVKDFRPVALLNIEGTIFFSLVSRKVEDHIITKNKIINSSVQKGCMAKVSGCWEHMSVVWDELKSTKVEKANIAAVWLDIANAYDSVPHQLIFFALRCYGVHADTINLLKTYYNGL